MTTVIQTEYQFTAQITGKATTPNGTPYLQFDWSLPGSQYPFQLTLGREPDVYESWGVQDRATVVIAQGALKSGKDAGQAYNFFWNLVDIVAAEDAPITRPERTPTPQSQPQSRSSPLPEPPGEEIRTPPPINGAVLGMCQNNAVTLIAAGLAWNPDELDMPSLVLQWRDILYRECAAIQQVAPEHYCYKHKQVRNQGPQGGWGHLDDTDPVSPWCIEPD